MSARSRSPVTSRRSRSRSPALNHHRSRSPPRSDTLEEMVDAVVEMGPYEYLTNELETNGWVPVGQVSTEDGQLHYIKAVTPQGFEAYVLVDSQGEMTRTDGTVYRVISNSPALVESESFKASAMRVGDECGCGMAMVCAEGVCMMTRNPDTMEVEETNFMVVAPTDSDYGVKADDVTPLPIVYYTDVMNDHALQAAKIMDANVKQGVDAFASCMASQKAMIEAHEVFDRLAKTHLEAYHEAWGNLLKTIKDRREVRSAYPGNLAEMDPQDADLIRAVAHDLSNRGEMAQALLRACPQAEKMRRYFTHASETMAEQILYLRDHYSEDALQKDVQ